ncbi:MAG TPA: class I SAM-dependent methyltransferase [Bryobacteraceae bacterium]|jgi:SAM-dependent methyltransferase|nr:class I SAM-dependent methyltransferase [Bryobacteraceae bacterium]
MRTQLIAVTLLTVAFVAAQNSAPKKPLDVPYVPSPNPVVEGMLKLADVKSSDTLYDLGCGDGRIVIAAAKTYGAHAVGVDINPERVSEARENARKAGVESLVRFEEKDLFDTDIHDATVVTLYLLPNVNLRLRPKLLKDLKPGTRVVSHSFDMESWKPDKEELVEGRHIYLWTIPSKP